MVAGLESPFPSILDLARAEYMSEMKRNRYTFLANDVEYPIVEHEATNNLVQSFLFFHISTCSFFVSVQLRTDDKLFLYIHW